MIERRYFIPSIIRSLAHGAIRTGEQWLSCGAMSSRRKTQARLELPSEPLWDDPIPRLVPIPGEAGLQGMTTGVRVPGGEVVAGFASESLAREFIAILGAHYTERAEK